MRRRHQAVKEAQPRFLSFSPCEFCSFDIATGEGARSCHYYECPYLPEELDVRCPTCLFNFYTREGQPGCGDTPTCDFARTEARERVANLRTWREARTAR